MSKKFPYQSFFFDVGEKGLFISGACCPLPTAGVHSLAHTSCCCNALSVEGVLPLSPLSLSHTLLLLLLCVSLFLRLTHHLQIPLSLSPVLALALALNIALSLALSELHENIYMC